MTIKDITNCIEEFAPLNYAEGFDNVGLLIGNYTTKVSGVIVTLDTLENVVDEAIEKNCNLIVSFHPIIFSGLKKINGTNYVERVVLKAIKNDIAIYAMHTALDNSIKGVNAKICDVLGLKNQRILIPQKNTIKKLTTYAPQESADKVRTALFKAGAGNIGNYDYCSYNTEGFGTYRGNENSNPVIGEKGKFHAEKETFISVIFEKHLEKNILAALFIAHPYEEVAYDIVSLDNTNQEIGMGMLGELNEEKSETDFLNFLKTTLNAKGIRHSVLLNKPIKTVAVLGGSGSFAIENAINAKADIYITADIKYHEFYKAENKLIIADIGHYESEQFTKNLLVEILTKKFPNFAIILSKKTQIQFITYNMAKKKEVTVEEKLRALYDLQLIDSRVDEIKNVRGELPLEIEDLEDEIVGLNKRLTNLDADVTNLKNDISAKKNIIEEANTLVKKYAEQQKKVRNNREFNSLSKETEYQELEIELAEKRIKEFKAQIEQKNEIIISTKENIAKQEDLLKHKSAELNDIMGDTVKEETLLLKKSEEYSELIDDHLLKAYKRIRSSVKNGLAVVSIERGASGGSFFTIPPQRQVEIASRKKIITDEHSGRILVDGALAEEEKEKIEKLLS